MFNLDNFGICTGRISAIKTFVNSDNSKTVRFTVATQNAFTSADGSRGSQFLPFTDFIPANSKSSIYDLLGKGDRVSVEYTIFNNNFTDADGVQHYDLSLRVDTIKFAETRAAREYRHEHAA